MTLTFSITADDFLEYHLYMASKSAVITRKRFIAKYVFSILYILMGIWFYAYERPELSALFIILGLLWFFFYPVLNSKSMQRFYEKYIDENYKTRLKRTTEMTISKDFIYVNDSTSESKVRIDEFEKIIETANCIFLKFKSGTSFIIPKKQVNIDEVKLEIKTLNIPMRQELNWKWR